MDNQDEKQNIAVTPCEVCGGSTRVLGWVEEHKLKPISEGF